MTGLVIVGIITMGDSVSRTRKTVAQDNISLVISVLAVQQNHPMHTTQTPAPVIGTVTVATTNQGIPVSATTITTTIVV